MEKIRKDIGKVIRELRQTAGMTQQKLAEQVGVAYQQIQKFEKGRSNLSVPRLMRLSNIFGVPVQDFIYNNTGVRKAAWFSNFSEDEVTMLMLYRNLPSKKRRMALLDMLNDMLRLSGGSPRARGGQTEKES